MKKHSSTPYLLRIIWFIRVNIIALVVILLLSPIFPRLSHEEESHKIQEASVIVLDISKSMENDDILPSRIEFAKNLLSTHINSLGYVGIVIFAGKTFVLSPITDDFTGLQYLIETLETDTINQGEAETSGTNIGDALIQASTLFSREIPTKNIILITDGRANIGLDPMIAAGELKNKNIHTSTLALGSASGIVLTHIVDGKREPLLDGSGNTINGAVDLETLSQIADITGGKLIHLTNTEEGLSLRDIFGTPKVGKNNEIFFRFDTGIIALLLGILGLCHFILSLFFWRRYKTP